METRGLHHVVVVVRDMDLARAHYARVFGDQAVAQVLDAEGYRRCIVPIGAQRLELCQPVGPGDGAGQASSAFRNSLDHRGEGLHNLAIEVQDVDATWSELEAAGVPLIGSSLSHSFFVHPRALNGALVQFLGTGQL
jgi:catechol 2,3-dioxygenase-like lactoylglutathione lyase family enzyme